MSEVQDEIVVPEPPKVESGQTPTEIIEAKILALLGVYPILSASMIQAGLGPSLSASLWRPVLTALLSNGTLIQWEQAPAQASQHEGEGGGGRTRPYLCIARADQLLPKAAA